MLVKGESGVVDDVFGRVTNPFGKEVDVSFFDLPKNAG